jgi:hypothetical protein
MSDPPLEKSFNAEQEQHVPVCLDGARSMMTVRPPLCYLRACDSKARPSLREVARVEARTVLPPGLGAGTAYRGAGSDSHTGGANPACAAGGASSRRGTPAFLFRSCGHTSSRVISRPRQDGARRRAARRGLCRRGARKRVSGHPLVCAPWPVPGKRTTATRPASGCRRIPRAASRGALSRTAGGRTHGRAW